MKNVKKFVGILLVVAMLICSMATVAFAEVPDGKTLRYVVKADKASYAKDEVATFTIYAEFAPEAGVVLDAGGEFWLGYQNAQFGPITPYVNDVNGSKMANYGCDMGTSPMASYISAGDSTAIDGIDEAQAYFDDYSDVYEGMDGSMHIALCAQESAELPEYGAGLTELMQFQLKAQDDLAANSFKVLVVVGDTYLNLVEGDDNQYDLDAVSTEFEAAAAPAVVFHNKVQVQWANEAENTINLGFKGYFKSADIGITFDGTNKSENVSAVGVEVTGAKEATGVGKYVFTPDEGTTYYFRGVIEGLDLDNSAQANTPITVRYFVVYNGKTLYSDPVSLKTAAEYAEVLKK